MDLLKVNKMEKIYLITTIVFLFSTAWLMINNHLLNADKIHDLLEIDALKQQLAEKQERLRNYSLTALELNNICDKFPSSRKEKANNEKLQELLNELN